MNSPTHSNPLSRAFCVLPLAQGRLKWLGYQLLSVIAIALIVTLVLVLFAGQRWAPTLVYSACISLACSGFVQAG